MTRDLLSKRLASPPAPHSRQRTAPGDAPIVVVPLTCREDSQVFVGDESVLEKSTKLRETQLLAMIRHPYIVQYEDSFVEDGSLFVSMEYAGAGTLERYTGVCVCVRVRVCLC